MYFLANDTNLVPIFIALICITVPVIILALIIFIKMIVKNMKKMRAAKEEVDYEILFGGKDNIVSIEVVLSRVNVEVKDVDKVQLDELKNQGIGVLISGNMVKCSNQSFADKVNNSLKK